jgi:hypothetical protein
MTKNDPKRALTELLISIGQFKKPKEVLQHVLRMSKYDEHRDLMVELDLNSALYGDILDDLLAAYDEALDEIGNSKNGGKFISKYSLLDQDGQDKLWAPQVDLSVIGSVMPWR